MLIGIGGCNPNTLASGVFCHKNHAQASNEKGDSFDNIVFLIVVFINQKKLTLREPLLLLVEKMGLEPTTS